MNADLLNHVLSHPHGAAGAFRSMVGYPLFGSAFQTLWPLFLIPLLTALVGLRATRLLPRRQGAWIPAALLAALPGLLALNELWLALDPEYLGALDNWRAWLLVRVVPAIGLLLVVRAMLRAARRSFEMRRLDRLALAPGLRLGRAAGVLGIRARELPTDASECFVAGVLRPTVYVSRGALSRLGEPELLAALHHERAHLRGRDTLLLSLLSFLCDLAPLAPAGITEAYQAAREAAADRMAVAHAGSLNLASALLALAGPAPVRAGSLPMAKPETLRWRLQAILEGSAASSTSWSRALMGVGLAALFLAWPYAQVWLHDVFCWS